MDRYTTSAIVLRRRDYGDFDLIVTAFTSEYGKRTFIAKAAKKSVKRFPGILEPFNALTLTFRPGRRKGMDFLEEASLNCAFAQIRSDFTKTAYASYWSECIASWVQEEQIQPQLYSLLFFVLQGLADAMIPAGVLNVLFQMRFIGQEGLEPVLAQCSHCCTNIDDVAQDYFCVDLSRGGVVCHQCPTHGQGQLQLSKGTLKQLLWIASGDLDKAKRVRFTSRALSEATLFLEAFVPYHIGYVPKSLKVLKQIRRQTQPITE
jgi:DNA repair protein RecO (recombination protein O)